MKYIRTEDGRIKNRSDIVCYAFREDYFSDDWDRDIEEYLRTKIVKQANTIEELCNEFVLISSVNKKAHPFLIKYRLDDKGIRITFDDYSKRYKDNEDIIFGAIWTDKGLIYVAKMNEKGELELL